MRLYNDPEIAMIIKKQKENEKQQEGKKCSCGALLFIKGSVRRCLHKCK